MLCASCGAEVAPGNRFCPTCGSPVASETPADQLSLLDEPTPAAVPIVPTPTESVPTVPVPTVPMPTLAPSSPMPLLPESAPIGDLPPVVVPPVTAWPIATTGELPVVVATQPFRITPLVLLSVLAGACAVASSLLEFVAYTATGDLIDGFSWRLNDLASNLMVGTVIGAVLMVVGSCIGATGRRFWSGLAGGAGLAIAGVLGAAVGTGVGLLDTTKVRFVTSGATVTLTTTYGIGWVLAVSAAGLGGVVFLMSLPASTDDHRRRLDPFVALLGILGALAVAVGPLIPGSGGSWSDNVMVDEVPPVAVYLRLLPLVLVVLGSLAGFTGRRRWGLGMVLGSIAIGAWQTVTALAEIGDMPLGIAGGNPGAVDAAHQFRPHVVTMAGVGAVLLALVVNSVVAVVRRRPKAKGQSPDARRTAAAATS